ncbi:cupredoxin domain-containing protein [Paenibacillus agricola]|uniref:Cytochrome C oxidase subunit II n=1 Tax=Paenibacillus agricola TaxID=2716264 RepID=A0ABX0IZZ9_9BACL|nr:cupredoxin domain-containing protein [Paenibacillus agricola]NHN29288.1 cytochrome C oxidase subunit II [Paenibacillus agricola]
MKKIIVLALSISLMFVMSACGQKAATPATAPAPATTGSAPTAAAPAASGAQQVKLVASNYKFDQAEYKVKAGQDVTVTLDNKEGMHGVAIDAFKVKLDGSNKTATFKADKPGTYDIVCSVPCGSGHMTMKSKLIVE